LELFTVLENAKGKAANETVDRHWDQVAVDGIYRFLADEQLFVAGRINEARGMLAGMADRVTVQRVQLSGGWFITPSLLMKVEWANQKYFDFPRTDIRSRGQFRGTMIEAVVSF
jgi:hypothetical protein